MRSLVALLALAVSMTVISMQVRGDERQPSIYMIGDSTMADKPLFPSQPERGWGQLLPIYLKNPTAVHNFARNGRSSKSFVKEGLWKKVVDSLQPGDWVIIQFGHNDQKKDSPERFVDAATEYRDYLRMFIQETRQKGAEPILATSIVRRRFGEDGKYVDTLGGYPEAVRIVGKETNTPVIDLNVRTQELLESYGPERSKSLFLHIDKGIFASAPDGKRDDTHLSSEGASRVAELALDELRRLQHPIANMIRQQ